MLKKLGFQQSYNINEAVKQHYPPGRFPEKVKISKGKLGGLIASVLLVGGAGGYLAKHKKDQFTKTAGAQARAYKISKPVVLDFLNIRNARDLTSGIKKLAPVADNSVITRHKGPVNTLNKILDDGVEGASKTLHGTTDTLGRSPRIGKKLEAVFNKYDKPSHVSNKQFNAYTHNTPITATERASRASSKKKFLASDRAEATIDLQKHVPKISKKQINIALNNTPGKTSWKKGFDFSDPYKSYFNINRWGH